MQPAAVLSLAERDQIVVENALPAHLMFLMMEECQKIGIVLRADVMDKLNVASAQPLAKLDTFSVARLAKRIDDVARSLLHDLSPDDPRHGLYCCAMFTMTLVDEGFLLDRTNMAVLVALMLMSDIEDENKGVDGEGAVWRIEQGRWKKEAGSMHVRAALLGVFNKRRHK